MSICLLVLPLLSQALDITFRKQTISVEGLSGEPIWIGSPISTDAELVLVFSNADATVTKSISATQPFSARVLAVGGGGAGGTVRSSSSTGHPGGGGGGAGELVDRNGVSFNGNETYSIVVGAGGQPQGSSIEAKAGGNGGESAITSTTGDLLRVKGGGGGGGETVGSDGGSGGGGSNKGAAGGAVVKNEVDGQGNAGGTSAQRYAAGGGGAGGVGEDAQSARGGNGGDGVEIDIDPNHVRHYAAGGGGGHTATTGTPLVGVGGKGGGGNGGAAKDDDASAPTAGENGTGSGGGGGGRYKPGAAGGSGIIIIRITWIKQEMKWRTTPIYVTGSDGSTRGEIYVDVNAQTAWVGNDLVITYTDTLIGGGLRLQNEAKTSKKVWANAEVLLVGGGGGGGFVNAIGIGTGGGAGGGAGGLVEANNLLICSDTEYDIAIGAGGTAGTNEEGKEAGGNGGLSSIKGKDGRIDYQALGGGGGGAKSAGSNGGSGGVGSKVSGSEQPAGGSGTVGQGFAGGEGDANNRGAGGGGANGAGKNASEGGAGGEGKISSITGTEVAYAGGGGGAYLNNASETFSGGTAEAGGGAGAGRGASGVIKAQDGTDGLGGGGGGGTGVAGDTNPAGRGGSGVVIIRLRNIIVGGVPFPTTKTFVYDGTEKSPVDEYNSWVYTLGGDYTATNADVYAYTATLRDDVSCNWVDGTREVKTTTWKITPMPVRVPEVLPDFALTNSTPTKYDGDPHPAVHAVDADHLNGGVDADGVCWTNGFKFCTLSDYQWVNAGTNRFTATLVADYDSLPNVTNFMWVGGSISDKSALGHLAVADNEITGFTIGDVQEGRDLKPTASWTWQAPRYGAVDKIVYTYFKGEEQPGSTNYYTIVDSPTEPGVYWAHAYICKDSAHEPGNWKAAHAYTRFCIWRHPAKTLTDFVNITASGATALQDFPVLVRLSEPVRDANGVITNGIPGFTYARAGLTGKELRFIQCVSDSSYKNVATNLTDELLPYEIDTWNPSGESRVWVKINPKAITSNSAKGKFRMYWHRDPTKELFVDKPAQEVWSAYTGVWHMDEEAYPAQAASVAAKDATGNGLDAVPKMGRWWDEAHGEDANGDYKEMVSVPGILGNARQIAKTKQTHGNFLEVPSYDQFGLGGSFMISFWVRYYENDKYPQLFCRRALTNAEADGWNIESSGANRRQLTVRGSTVTQLNATVVPANPENYNNYTHVTVVYDGSSVHVIANAEGMQNGNVTAAKDNGHPLAIGAGHFGAKSEEFPSFRGAFDEIRLAPLTSAYEAWAKAEYNTVVNVNFCTFGAVNMPSDDAEGGRVWVNYWSKDPTLERYYNTASALQTVLNRTGTATKGQLKFGGTITYFGTKMPAKEVWADEGKTVPEGTGAHLVEFDMNPKTLTSGDHPGRHILFDGTRIFDVEIVDKNPQSVDSLGPTASGRILLANDDMTPDAAGFTVTNQSYFEEAWYHHGTDLAPPEGFNLMRGTEHEYTNATKRLWKLTDVYIGNTLSTNHTLASTSMAILPENRITLPRGPNAKNLSSPEAYTNEIQWWETGHLILRNKIGAGIESSLFTNGIGRVYFDVVNAYGGDDVYETDNRLVVEWAEHTNDDEELVNWFPVELTVLSCVATSATTNTYSTGNTELTCLNHKRSAYSSLANWRDGKYFYRVIANINRREPTRFRIRRTADRQEDGVADPDNWKGWVLVDNVIASFPPPTPTIHALGAYDDSRTGSAVLGVEGAFSAQYPVAGDTLYGYGRIEGDVANVTSARLRYRWRYLDTESTPQIYAGRENWNIAYLNLTNNLCATIEPLDYPARYGDIEYYLDMTGFSEYYEYCDYTGIPFAEATKKLFLVEEPEKYVVARSTAPRYPSHGHDWFVRLREFRNPNRGYTLYTKTGEKDQDENEIVTTNALELVGTNAWRVCVRTEKPVDELFFRLESDRPASTAIGETATVTNCWRMTEGSALAVPYTFGYTAGDANAWASVPCDAKTGYLLFSIDETKQELSVYRADLQDFNRWSTAVNTNELFVGNSVDSNSVSYATNEYNPEWEEWQATPETRENWHEDFKVGKGMIAPQVYPRNRPFSNFRSQRNWTAQNGMWTYGKWAHVSEKTVDDITVYGEGDDSAVQLEGRGKGALMYAVAEDIPDGLDTISYVARVAQYNEFNDFAYFDGAEVVIDPATPGKYSIVYARNKAKGTFVTMSALSESGDGAYDGDGSVSLVGFYRPDKGCYEARFSRGGKDSNVHIELYRWSVVGGQMTCTSLGYKEFDNLAAKLVRDNPAKIAGLYLSVEPYTSGSNSGSLVYAGILKSDVAITATSMSMSGQSFASVVYHDTSSQKLTQGTFGLLARNCPGVFVKPCIYSNGIGFLGGDVKPNELNLHSDKAVNFPIDTGFDPGSATEAFYENWMLPPGRTMRLDPTGHGKGTSFECWGFQGDTNVTQKIIVQLSEHGENKWIDAVTNTVAGFCDQSFKTPIKSGVKRDVRLQVMGVPEDTRRDVVINEVKMSQWNGQWTEFYDQSGDRHYLKDKFVYTAGWIVDDPRAINARALRLQPARAPRASNPVSLRTPLLRGLGLFHFQWRNADSRGKIHIQVCETATENNILSLTDAQQDDERWETVETIDMATAGTTGSHTVYLNRRYGGKTMTDGVLKDYYFGVVRLIIDKDVEAFARTDEIARTDSEYGMLEIIDAFAWDLPEYDPKGWTGWNFRAAGWNGADPDTFANLTDGTRGLSGLLNNTLDAVSLAQRPADYYKDRIPNVQSPTFGTNCVGEISFRARLYNPGDAMAAGHGAAVAIYGSKELDEKGEPKPNSWKKAGEVIVTNTVYALHSFKLKSSDGFVAVRLGVEGVKGVTEPGTPTYDTPLRVALDDIVIWEKLPLSVSFRKDHVRPFRSATALKLLTEVKDITSAEEQPLLEESFGFQGEVVIANTEEILVDDPDYPVTVDLWYYPNDDVWGFENWSNRVEAVHVTIPEATDKKLVFRSNTELAESLCPPQFAMDGATHKIVQYQLIANFYDQSHEKLSHAVSADEWAPPAWNTGFVDPNKDAKAKFSPYTVLEAIAPKRAWINEVNYCEPTRTASQASQWVELAVPSGVDMSGWKLNLYDYDGSYLSTLATIGQHGWPSNKNYIGSSPAGLKSHYAFYVIKSPNTVLNANEYDAIWSDSFNGGGMLDYTSVYCFELVRPSGIVEHRAVVQGWNQYHEAGYYFADLYDGSNVVDQLNQKLAHSDERWVWAEEDRHTDGTDNCSVNVTNEQGLVHANWASPLKATPGDINTNQYIDPSWYTLPNGGYVWIYSTVLGNHLRQLVEGNPTTFTRMTLPQGTTTNLVYEVDHWYQLADFTATGTEGRTNITVSAGVDGKRLYNLTLSSISNRIDITVKADASEDVLKHMKESDMAYRPAILKWLEKGVTGGADGGEHQFKGDEIKLGYYRGVDGTGTNELDLTTLYWLDLDPTDGNWELWGGMGTKPGWPGVDGHEKDSLWPVVRERKTPEGLVIQTHTNVQSVVWLMLTNTADHVAYAPYRLQGLGNEQSDHFSGAWTSETFKVTAALQNGKMNDFYFPMRYFVFGRGSFGGSMASELSPFGALIEITDPFSRESPASEWGWRPYAENGVLTGWKLDKELTPAGVSTLKASDTLSF